MARRDVIAPAGTEAPRLAASSMSLFAGGAYDTSALRRIIEVQAEDLVRLRRELAGARERSIVAREDGRPKPEFDGGSLGGLSESALLDMIKQAQSEIEAATERSRWVRLGRRLGFSRPTDWESSDWRSPFIAENAAQEAVPGAAALRGEYLRLVRLQEELSRSRWRQLGHRLRLSQPFTWDIARIRQQEIAPARNVPLVAPPVSAQSATLAVEPLAAQFVAECRSFAIDTVLDVGANAGQFGTKLRGAGWKGHVVSFEPLSDAHAALRVVAGADALWDVAERCALGSSNGETEINVASNSWSSSILPMADLHRAAAPQSTYSHRETCPVRTLDYIIGSVFTDPTTLFAIKIDTQGYEKEVLEGLTERRSQVKVILCEMSLAELYEGAPDLKEMLSYLAAAGYHCVGLEPAFRDPRSGRLLQVDGLFVAH